VGISDLGNMYNMGCCGGVGQSTRSIAFYDTHYMSKLAGTLNNGMGFDFIEVIILPAKL
jgi:hypothetical protein